MNEYINKKGVFSPIVNNNGLKDAFVFTFKIICTSLYRYFL